MSHKKKHLIATVLSLVLVLPLLMGFSLNAEDIPEMDPGDFPLPIVEEPITLNIMVSQTELQGDFNEMWFFKAYEKLSNVHVEFDSVSSEIVEEKRNLAVNSPDQPDAYFRMGFPTNDISKYASQGLFIPLDDMLEEYGSNYLSWLEKYPDAKAGVTMPDGQIYSMPYFLADPAITMGARLWFNGEALEKVGLEVPVTIDELTEVLRAFKELDYNENGEADEIPVTSSHLNNIETILLGSWGLRTRGSNHEFDIDPETGELRYVYGTDQYREVLEYENMLYSEGLIDQDIFTVTTADLVAKGTEGRALSYAFVNHSIIGELSNKTKGMIQPFEGPHGDTVWSNQGSALSGAGSFLITATNEYPAETLRWADYFYSDAGIRQYFMGIEGDSYEAPAPATYYVTEEGTYEYTKYVMENESGLMFEEVLGTVVPWAGGGNPSVANSDYFKGGEMQSITKETADKLAPYSPETIWGALVFDAEVTDEVATISADLKTYHEEQRANFISGNTELNDETWAEYLSGLESFKLPRYMEIYQETIERSGLE